MDSRVRHIGGPGLAHTQGTLCKEQRSLRRTLRDMAACPCQDTGARLATADAFLRVLFRGARRGPRVAGRVQNPDGVGANPHAGA
jgi:hypothetical protein